MSLNRQALKHCNSENTLAKQPDKDLTTQGVKSKTSNSQAHLLSRKTSPR